MWGLSRRTIVLAVSGMWGYPEEPLSLQLVICALSRRTIVLAVIASKAVVLLSSYSSFNEDYAVCTVASI